MSESLELRGRFGKVTVPRHREMLRGISKSKSPGCIAVRAKHLVRPSVLERTAFELSTAPFLRSSFLRIFFCWMLLPSLPLQSPKLHTSVSALMYAKQRKVQITIFCTSHGIGNHGIAISKHGTTRWKRHHKAFWKWVLCFLVLVLMDVSQNLWLKNPLAPHTNVVFSGYSIIHH